MPDSFLVASTVLIAISTLAFAVGAIYIGGGIAAIRRQLPQIGLLALLIVAVALVAPLVARAEGSAFVLVLVVFNAAALLMWVRQRGPGSQSHATIRRNAWQMPGFRWLVIAYVAIVVIGTVALAIVIRPSP